MGKKSKKRQRSTENDEAASSDCHINISSEPALDSIESCFAEFEKEVYAEVEPQDESDTKSESSPTSTSGFPLIKPSAESHQERLTTWDAAFKTWNSGKHGHYTPGLLPCFETELARHFQMQKLSKYLLESCGDLKMPAFERWLLDAKLEEKQRSRASSSAAASSLNYQERRYGNNVKTTTSNQTDDPVLPREPSVGSKSAQRLIEEICETGTEKAKAYKIVKELFQRTQSSTQEIYSQNLRATSQTPFKSDRIEIERGSYLVSMLYSRKKWKSPFIVKINIAHYDKLRDRFLKTHADAIRDGDLDASASPRTKALHALHLHLMVITLRYSSFSGGQLLDDFRGGGMQGAINEQGFAVFKKFFPDTTLFECFASPLNVSLPMFASAFEELDWHFGSAGDLALCAEFQDNCCCEANPPFTPGYMEFLSEWIRMHLAKANAQDRALTFAVIVPAVHEKDLKADKTKVVSAVKRFAGRAHREMVESAACTRHILLRAREHGYVEGAQHLRPTRYKRSLYDTSVILLQSKIAQGRKLEKDKFEESIRVAFAERHSEEHKKRSKAKETEEKEE